MLKGVIKSLKNGFGYILADQSEKELLFHVSDLENAEFAALKEGDAVQFEEDPKGPMARHVTKLS